jgi:carbonic anhydrase
VGDPSPAAYESSLAWDPQRPDTVIISCVDGRWYQHVQEFARVHLKAGQHTDFMAVPGGIEPMTLADVTPKDYNFFRRRLESLVHAHGTRRIVAIAHQDCAWYRARKIGSVTGDIRSRQIADLRRSASLLREMFDAVTIETYFARLDGTNLEKVVFEPVSTLVR